MRRRREQERRGFLEGRTKEGETDERESMEGPDLKLELRVLISSELGEILEYESKNG